MIPPPALSVLVCTPKYTAAFPWYTRSLDALLRHAKERGITMKVLEVTGAPIDAARDSLANAFMRGDFDLMFMVDGGVGFGLETFDRLYAAAEEGFEFTSAAVPLRQYNVDLATKVASEAIVPERSMRALLGAFALSPVLYEGRPIARVIAGQTYIDMRHIGAACIMVARSVFEKIQEEEPGVGYIDENTDEPSHGYFLPDVFEVDGVRRRCGEDVAFCHRWTRAGGHIWTLLDAMLTHEGHATFVGNFALNFSEAAAPTAGTPNEEPSS